jgi:hypothetical protein
VFRVVCRFVVSRFPPPARADGAPFQPAASSSGVRKDIIATSTTNYTTIKAPRSKAHASPPDTFVALPIEDGYMGTHRLLSESDFKDYWLCWDRTKSLLSISDSRPVNSKPNFIWQCNKTGWQTMEVEFPALSTVN